MSFKTLLVLAVMTLIVCALLVTLCYFFVDRPIAYFVHDNHLSRFEVLKWLTYLPVYLEHAAPIILVLGAVRLAWGPLTRFERMVFAAALSLTVALLFKNALKGVFGRYWPNTWVDNNPSLIRDGNSGYGFHPFHEWTAHDSFLEGMAYDSFPSGHTTRIFALMVVVGIAYPRWWWLCASVCTAVIIGLVGMNYHFVGDVVGGIYVGSITALYTAHFFRLDGAGTELTSSVTSSAV